MKRHVIAGLVLLAIWLLLGPVAMAFGGCAGCELPCAQLACAIASAAPTPAPEMVASATISLELHPIAAIPATLELPPKLSPTAT
jgi:hypothetical protein